MIDLPHVNDAKSAEAFIRWCVNKIGPGFHPDTPFAEYVTERGRRCFTDEAIRLDALTAEACGFCDVYCVALDAAKPMLG